MEKIVNFLKKYGWKGLIVLIVGLVSAFLFTSVTGCSAIRAGYERTRYIESVDSTYIHYKPSADASFDRATRARVTRVRDVRHRTSN